jgi:predicted permease
VQDRLFRLLLRLLPLEFRQAYARDAEATFRAERRDVRGGWQLLALWIATVADVIRAAPQHHWDILSRDIRFASRLLLARPAHTSTAVGTLALGLGVSVAMFAVLDAVWFAPLPYRDPDRLVRITETSQGGDPGNLGYLTFVDLRSQARSARAIAAAAHSTATLTGNGRDAERVAVMRASSNYLEMLGVAPALGRRFTDAEDRPGPARRVAILSDRLWRRRFGANPAVINQPIQVNGDPFIVVGVLPAGFNDLVASRLFDQAEMWTPLGYDPGASFACRTCRHLSVFARLAPGVEPDEAQRELSGSVAAAARAHPTEYHEPAIRVARFSDEFLGPVRRILIVLACAGGLLLLVACGNVANLLLIRATEREHEVAIRTALGVTTPRLIRQLVTESLLLAVIGGLASLPVADAVVRLFVRYGPAQLPRLGDAALDGRTLAAALVLVAASGVLFGLAPIWQLRKRDVSSGMQGGQRRTAGAETWRLRGALAGSNVALAAMLLVGSGLLVRSLMGLLAVPIGFNPDHLLTFRVSLAGARYTSRDNARDIAATVGFYSDLVERLKATPGVLMAAGVSTLPLGGGVDGYGLHVVGRPEAHPEAAPSADRFVVTPDYFDTMRIPLLRGRLLDRTDDQTAAPVAVVGQTLARQIFPNDAPIGHQIRLGGPDAPPRTIVGVVGDVRHHGFEAPLTAQVYVPQAQWVWAETDMTVVVRAAGDPGPLSSAARDVVKQIDSAQPVTDVRTYDDVVAEANATRRVAAQLLGAFALAAFALAMVGLYGALSVVAAQRRREIGVRMALGARAHEIRRLVLAQGLRPAFAGLVTGLAIAAATAGALQSLLYGITGFDLRTFAAAALILSAGAGLACAVPAWRASQVNPAAALKIDA